MIGLHASLSVDDLWVSIVSIIDSILVKDHLTAAFAYLGQTPITFRTTVTHCNHSDYFRRMMAADPPFVGMARRQPDKAILDLNDEFDEECLKRTRFWKEIMEPDGWRHSIALPFWNRGEFCSHIGISRSDTQGPFTAQEKSMLGELHPYFEAGIRRVLSIAHCEMQNHALAQCLDHAQEPLLILDPSLRILHCTNAALHACHVWIQGMDGPHPRHRGSAPPVIPREILHAASKHFTEHLQSLGHQFLPTPCSVREIVHPTLPGLSARLRIIPTTHKPTAPCLCIGFSRNLIEGGFSPLHRLSHSEMRVTRLVYRGLSNEQVARELSISVNTVRSHLREVFSKLGVTSRGKLAMLLRQSGHMD